MSYAATGGEVDVRNRGGLTDNDDALRARHLLDLRITAIVLFASVLCGPASGCHAVLPGRPQPRTGENSQPWEPKSAVDGGEMLKLAALLVPRRLTPAAVCLAPNLIPRRSPMSVSVTARVTRV
jgi:hypothetical protein